MIRRGFLRRRSGKRCRRWRFRRRPRRPNEQSRSTTGRVPFSITPDGGFVMGNPKAKVTIVEYGSLTCPHCRHFAETAYKPLVSEYVRTGKVSYEFRSLILNGIDLAATLVARCGGPSHFFPMTEKLYATQPTWIGKITDARDREAQRLAAGPDDARRRQGHRHYSDRCSARRSRGKGRVLARRASRKRTSLPRWRRRQPMPGSKEHRPSSSTASRYRLDDWATLQPFLKDAGG